MLCFHTHEHTHTQTHTHTHTHIYMHRSHRDHCVPPLLVTTSRGQQRHFTLSLSLSLSLSARLCSVCMKNVWLGELGRARLEKKRREIEGARDTKTPWLLHYQAVKDGRPERHTCTFTACVCVCGRRDIKSLVISPLCKCVSVPPVFKCTLCTCVSLYVCVLSHAAVGLLFYKCI